MNYLISVYLNHFITGRDRMVGNVIAEFIKYSKKLTYESEVEVGIDIHNRYCEFVKSNLAFNRSKGRINTKYSRYSNDIVKLYYSHFLALHWEQITHSDLNESIKDTYLSLLENFELVPSKLNRMMPALLSSPGLMSLRTLGGLHNFIVELSKNGFCVAFLQNTIEDLLTDYGAFKEDFDCFIMDLKKFGEMLNKEAETVDLAVFNEY